MKEHAGDQRLDLEEHDVFYFKETESTGTSDQSETAGEDETGKGKDGSVSYNCGWEKWKTF